MKTQLLLLTCRGGALFPRQQRFPRLTLPDPPSVDVDLNGEAGVQRLVVVQDDDVAAEGVHTGGVHRCILGWERGAESDYITTSLEHRFSN